MNILYTLEKSLAHSFWFLPPDLHERQRYIGTLVSPGSTILDVGGEKKILIKQVDTKKYISVNIDKIGDTDIVYDGKHLPFDDNSFDVVLCIDVLEHVPRKDRTALIKEMSRVAKKRIICSAPLGTDAHSTAEKELLADFNRTDISVPFLEEHVQNGLPTPQEVIAWKERFKGSLSFSGNYLISNALLRLHVKESKNTVINHLLFLTKLLLNSIYNIVLYPFLIDKKEYSETTNRFYLVIDIV